jgi:diguanylate cyclase (GGDEF)-like protein
MPAEPGFDRPSTGDTAPMAHQDLAQIHQQPRTPLLVMVVSAALFSIIAALALVWENRDHTIEAADRDNSDIARLVSFHVSHVLGSSVRFLDEAATTIRSRGIASFRSDQGQRFLVTLAAKYPELQAIALADEQGQLVVASSLPYPPPNIDYSDREYFRRHRAGEGLVIGEVIMSRSLGRRGTTISRAIRSPQGKLEGVVLITIESAHFMELFRKIQRAPHQAISVLRMDGAVFVRSPEVELGSRVPQAPVFEHAARGGSGVYFEEHSAIDGLARLIAFETVDGFPLLVAASQTRDEVLAPWRTFAGFVGGGLLLTLGLLGIASAHAFKSVAQNEVLNFELERQASTDSLTGLFNRRQFLALADNELSRSKRYSGPVAVLMMDIDHFKKINDTYGHKIGDLVLQRLASLCTRELRDIDSIGRIGGEEFAILLPNTNGERAAEVAERLRKTIAETGIALEQGLPLHFTVSIGVATTHDVETNVDTLLSQADDALYEAKRAGRNRVAAG